MHEAGLAAAVADALRREGVEADGARVLIHVSGGHAHAEDWDGAFRLHLGLAAPEYAGTPVDIVHEPVDRLCVAGAHHFAAPSADDPCPACGGSSLPVPIPERIEIEVVRPHVAGP